MLSKRTPLSLRKHARKLSGCTSHHGNQRVPALRPDEDDNDADSNLVGSSKHKESSAAALKSGRSDVIPDSGQQQAATPDGDPVPLRKNRSSKEVLLTRPPSLTRSLSGKKKNETKDVYDLHDSQTKSGISDVCPDSGQQKAATPGGDPVPLRKNRSLKEVLRTRSRSLTSSLSGKKNNETNVNELDDSQKKSGIIDVSPDSGQQEASTPVGDPVPLIKKGSLKEVLRTRSRSLTRSLSWTKNNETKYVYELDDSQTLDRRSRSRSRSLSTIHSLKLDSLLAISNEHVTPVTPPMETPQSTPSDASPQPLSKKRSLKDRLLLRRPSSISNESDVLSTRSASPESSPLSFGPPRITISAVSQDVVHDAFLVQSRGVKKLASPREPEDSIPSSSDEDTDNGYEIPQSYSLSTDKPVPKGRSDKSRKEYVVEKRHWGSRAVRKVRSNHSDAHSQSQASESTWIPTEDERYKLASAFIFGEEEFSNVSVESTSLFTDLTGYTATTEGDTRSNISQSTSFETDMFSGFTDYSEGTEVTTKTQNTGYTTGSGDTSESSGTNTYSYSEVTSFVSSRITATTDETSMFDLGFDDDDEDTSIENHANHRKRYNLGLEGGTPDERDVIRRRKRYEYKRPKKSRNVVLEVISDLLDLRNFATTCLPCHGKYS